jgi:hypothetical protein
MKMEVNDAGMGDFRLVRIGYVNLFLDLGGRRPVTGMDSFDFLIGRGARLLSPGRKGPAIS